MLSPSPRSRSSAPLRAVKKTITVDMVVASQDGAVVVDQVVPFSTLFPAAAAAASALPSLARAWCA